MSKRTRAGAFGVLGVAAALAAGLGIYPVFFRRQCLTWGARPDEVSRQLPGDELLPGAGIVATRAITIDALPAAIWPWLVQMGSGRGGVYTYDWIENLFGLDMHSTRRILPQYQDVKVGDEFPLGPAGRPWGSPSSTRGGRSRSGSPTGTGCGSSRCSPRTGTPG